MSDKNEIGVTVISHGSKDKTLVDGYEVGGSYSRDIHYNGANMPQLVSLINVSLFCEQLIKYECFSSNMEFAFGCHVIQWKGLTGVEQLLIVVSAHAE